MVLNTGPLDRESAPQPLELLTFLQRYLMDLVIFQISFSCSMKGPYHLHEVVDQRWVLLETVFHPKKLYVE